MCIWEECQKLREKSAEQKKGMKVFRSRACLLKPKSQFSLQILQDGFHVRLWERQRSDLWFSEEKGKRELTKEGCCTGEAGSEKERGSRCWIERGGSVRRKQVKGPAQRLSAGRTLFAQSRRHEVALVAKSVLPTHGLDLLLRCIARFV